jgi:hypothetical protein
VGKEKRDTGNAQVEVRAGERQRAAGLASLKLLREPEGGIAAAEGKGFEAQPHRHRRIHQLGTRGRFCGLMDDMAVRLGRPTGRRMEGVGDDPVLARDLGFV